MSVDFPSAYSANAVSTAKPIDTQTLQDAFAAVLRSYGTERGGSQTNTMLEIIRSTSSPDNTDANDRNQLRREYQQQIDRNDSTLVDRKTQGKSELRQSEMNAADRDRLDRHESLRYEHQARSEQREPLPSPHRTDPTTLATPSLNVVQPSETLLHSDHSLPMQRNVVEIAGTNNQTIPGGITAPNSASVNIQSGVSIPLNVNVPSAVPVPTAPQVVPPQVFNVFTTLRQFGKQQDKSDENEDEKEEQAEENTRSGQTTKKKSPFAVFEAIHAETMRPVRKNQSRQLQDAAAKPELHRQTKGHRERPKEIEPEQHQHRSVKTLDELINTSAQSVVGLKKEETKQHDRRQYLNRIASACEASAHFAPIRIKINLDHLGTLTLRFYHKADKLMLRFETPTRESARFLLDHLGGLKTILSERKVKIASVEVWQES
jgi:hypothetical protein